MIIPRCRDMVDGYDQEAEQNLSSHAEGTGLISAMVRLGVIRLCDEHEIAAAHSSGVGETTSAPREILRLGAGRPGKCCQHQDKQQSAAAPSTRF